MNRVIPLKRRLLAIALTSAATGAGPLVAAELPSAHSPNLIAFGSLADSSTPFVAQAGKPAPYLVLFDEPALADPQSPVAKSTKGKLQVRSTAAQSYVAQLKAHQDAFLQTASQAIHRPIAAISDQYRFVHALNGMAVRITADEAKTLAGLPGVRSVAISRINHVTTDRGPALIGAPTLWNGLSDLQPAADRIFGSTFETTTAPNEGEGVVIGDIDTGLDFTNPSFAETDIRGYTHTNPLGSGNYLGLCANPLPSWTPQCNAKVIGAYDMIAPLAADILAQYPNAIVDQGPVDQLGHGSHTAGTLAGNHETVQVTNGPVVNVSGVAPHANLVIYTACYTDTAGINGCPDIATAASADQAVADGIVDVLNFSISGGIAPWADMTSRAFLGASNAGIFVAAAAGNAGPNPGTSNHAEPWTTTVAASTHTRIGFFPNVVVDNPPDTPDLHIYTVFTPAQGLPAASLPLTYGYNNDPYLCTPSDVPAGQFAGKAVLIENGSATGDPLCTITTKLSSALTNGQAAAVIIYNNTPGTFVPQSISRSTTAPVAITDLANGQALVSLVNSGNVTMHFNTTLLAIDTPPDEIAFFSGRGPVQYPLLKPDVAAPGVRILAPITGIYGQIDGIGSGPGGVGDYGLMDGTSMATPHVGGAAALLKAAHPDWTPGQIKSALMMTAKEDMLLDDGLTVAGYYDRGSGRIQVDQAANSGLTLDDTTLNYALGDPADGGVPEALNVPSLISTSCVSSCSYTRTVRSVADHDVTWTVSADSGLPVTASPASFTLAAGATQSIALNLAVGGLPTNQTSFGEVILTPSDSSLSVLHIPVSTFVDPPKVQALTPDGYGFVNANTAVGTTTTQTLVISNIGNDGLDWQLLNGTQPLPILQQLPDYNYVLLSTMFIGFAAPYADTYGAFVADDFVMSTAGAVHRLHTDGYVKANLGVGTAPLSSNFQNITWAIYADDGGRPIGYPSVDTPPPATSTPLWSYTAAPGSAGVSDAAMGGLDLDLDAAGQTLNLAAGTYWLMAYARPLPDSNASWAQGTSGPLIGYPMKMIFNNTFIAAINNVPPLVWVEPRDHLPPGNQENSAAMTVVADYPCGAPWVSASTTSATGLGNNASSTVTITFDATNLTRGTSYSSKLCLTTNDPAHPLTLVPINLFVM